MCIVVVAISVVNWGFSKKELDPLVGFPMLTCRLIIYLIIYSYLNA